jgi:ribosome-binding factor A
MSVDRIERVNALIHREIAESLFQIMTDPAFDLAAVTVTHVITSRNLRTARVLVSIRGEEKEKLRMLGLLRRHRPEIQATLNKDLTLKYTPKLHLYLDRSVEEGDHVLDILSHLGDADTAPSANDDVEGELKT